MVRLPDLKAGIYRHWKGPLYLVLGYAHDANADEWEYRSALHTDEPYFPDGRAVVVYMGLQLDGAHTGPRLAVRTAEDFHTWVDSETGKELPVDMVEASQGSAKWIRQRGYCPRFEFVGTSYHPDMIDGDTGE